MSHGANPCYQISVVLEDSSPAFHVSAAYEKLSYHYWSTVAHRPHLHFSVTSEELFCQFPILVASSWGLGRKHFLNYLFSTLL